MARGICAVLAPHFHCMATAQNEGHLVEQASHWRPRLVILDIDTALPNGLDDVICIRRHVPAPEVLFFTSRVDSFSLKAAFDAGANGYLLKSAPGEELLHAVRRVLGGHIYVTASLVSGFQVQFGDAAHRPKPTPLSPREQQSLHWIAEGKAAKEIATILNISVKTVRFHRDNIARKLGCKTTAELTRYAITQGLV
jgi:DNA-binding NarL/FixJ family response regulator